MKLEFKTVIIEQEFTHLAMKNIYNPSEIEAVIKIFPTKKSPGQMALAQNPTRLSKKAKANTS